MARPSRSRAQVSALVVAEAAAIPACEGLETLTLIPDKAKWRYEATYRKPVSMVGKTIIDDIVMRIAGRYDVFD